MNYRLATFLLLEFLFIFCFDIIPINRYIFTLKQPNPIPIQLPIIGWVTVMNNTENQIVWGGQINPSIDHYNIYRNSISQDVGWTLIGKVKYPGNSYFNDMNAYSNIQSYQYKVSIVDLCDDEISSSIIHETIKLDLRKKNDGQFSLNWNLYNGLKIESYHILRGTSPNNMVPVDSVSEFVASYTDNSFSNENRYYQVEGYGLIEDSVIVNEYKTNWIKIQSNIVSSKDDSILDMHNNIKIYPNPLSNYSIVVLPYNSIKPYQIGIYDYTGKTVYNQTVYSDEFILNRGNMKKGVYILQVFGNKEYRAKVIVEGKN